MAAAVTDKFKKVKGFFSTTLASQKNSGANTLSLSDATDVPTDTGLVFTVGRVDANGDPTPSTRAIYKGTLSGTTVSNLTLTEGTDQTHAAGTVVEITWTQTHVNDMVDGILEEHNQDGTHSDITADSIVVADGGTLDVDTINEATSGNGVSIDGVNFKDSKLNTDGSVVPDNLVGSTGTSWEWQEWEPVLTNFVIGTGGSAGVEARYIQIGKTVHYYIKATLGTSGQSVSNGALEFTLPVAPFITDGVIGVGSKTTTYPAHVLVSSGKARMVWYQDDAGTSSQYVGFTNSGAAVPSTWVAGEWFSASGTYEAD